MELTSIILLQQQLGPKIIDTNLVLMKMYIFICARVQRKKHAYILQRENWNKTNALVNIPKRKRTTKVMI